MVEEIKKRLSFRKQFDAFTRKYFKKSHPKKKFAIYPTWLEVCDGLEGKDVLNLGCRFGYTARMLAKNGAKVTAVDNSMESLEEAKEVEKKDSLGIEYVYADAARLPVDWQKRFDLVAPTFILNYASSRDELQMFVDNIANVLKDKGRMVAISFNPDYLNLSEENQDSAGEIASIKWVDEKKKDGSKMEVTTKREDGSKICSFENYYWSKEVLEECFVSAGFSKLKWVEPTMEGEKENGGEKSMISIVSAELL